MENLLQRCAASPIWTESVRTDAELRLVISFQHQPDNFLNELVAPSRYSQWAFLCRVFLLDIDAPDWFPVIPLVSEKVYNLLNAFERHAVNGFPIRSWGCRTSVSVDSPVGQQIQLPVEKLPIHTL